MIYLISKVKANPAAFAHRMTVQSDVPKGNFLYALTCPCQCAEQEMQGQWWSTPTGETLWISDFALAQMASGQYGSVTFRLLADPHLA
jgi:hypothetical protein